MPKFSVVIPCYNCASTIEAALQALKGQSLTNWEAVCIDDGSTDHTLRVLVGHAAQDDRIRVIRQQNAGPSRARNSGAALSRGDYIAFLDADDIWSARKLESALDAFNEHPHAGAVFGRVAFFRDGSAKVSTISCVKGRAADVAEFAGENPICTLSNLTVSRTRFLETGGFDETMRYSEDLEWLIRALAGGMQFVSTPDLHVKYRTSANGLSSDLLAMHVGWKRAVSSAGGLLSPRELLIAEALHLRYLARRALRTGAGSRIAVTLSLRGMLLAPRAFLGVRHRGPMTLLGCLASPLLPRAFRTRIFA